MHRIKMKTASTIPEAWHRFSLRQCKYLTCSFRSTDILLEPAKSAKKASIKKDFQGRKVGFSVTYTQCSVVRDVFLPASNLWQQCGNVERVNCLHSVTIRKSCSTFIPFNLVRLISAFLSSYCYFIKKIS